MPERGWQRTGSGTRPRVSRLLNRHLSSPFYITDRRRRQRAGRVRRTALARLRELRAAVCPRAQSADPVRDQLACRGRRNEAGRHVQGPEPAADHQCGAAPSEVAAGLDRLSGLVPRARPERPDSLCQPRAGPPFAPARPLSVAPGFAAGAPIAPPNHCRSGLRRRPGIDLASHPAEWRR
jgi:hypothetical protein